MSWWAKALQFAKTYKQRILWVLVAAIIFAGIYSVVSQFVTPFRDYTKQRSEFYVSKNAGKPTSLRATVVKGGDKEATVRIEEGPREGQEIKVKLVNMNTSSGDRVLLSVAGDGEISQYTAAFWRIPGLLALVFIFILAVFIVSGRRGLASLGGLFISIGVIVFGLIPAILQGANAFIASVVTAFAIAAFAILTAHGWRWRTVVSLVSIFSILALTVLLALLGEHMGNLTGIYDETSALLQIHSTTIDMRGILVGGIIIATLGVLDDVITTQTATIDELHKANKSLPFRELFRRGQSVGNEHVIALVNTLALAYVGVSLPMILSITLNMSDNNPLLMIFNSEYIAQEIVRTLVSSIALVVAIPVSTAIAALLIRHKTRIFAILKGAKQTKRRT